mmetsp:Transcript_5856/g.12780  ORF Transcript_5856/g.12780 Transcript_5856/m.12780 type:complete len:226 (-) Transcript_5856:1257-1934(-)
MSSSADINSSNESNGNNPNSTSIPNSMNSNTNSSSFTPKGTVVFATDMSEEMRQHAIESAHRIFHSNFNHGKVYKTIADALRKEFEAEYHRSKMMNLNESGNGNESNEVSGKDDDEIEGNENESDTGNGDDKNESNGEGSGKSDVSENFPDNEKSIDGDSVDNKDGEKKNKEKKDQKYTWYSGEGKSSGWSCVVGYAFSSCVTHRMKTYIHFSVVPNVNVLLWKS